MRTLNDILADVREYAKDANEYRAGLEEKIRQADEDIAAAKEAKEAAFQANNEPEYQAADERIRHAESLKEYSSRKLAEVKNGPAMDAETAETFRREARAVISAEIADAEKKIFQLVDDIRAVSDGFLKDDRRLQAMEDIIGPMAKTVSDNRTLTLGLKSYINWLTHTNYENLKRNTPR